MKDGRARRVTGRLLRWTGGLLLAVAALFAAAVLWPLPEARPIVTPHPLALTGATVLDVERGTATPSQTVLVEGGRIRTVGRDGSIPLPRDVQRVDARGAYLMPALWDMHAHVYAVSPLLDLPLYVAYGVLNVRDMQGCPRRGDPFIACADDKRRWSREAERGLRVGPRIVSSTSFMANGPAMRGRISGTPDFFGTDSPDAARAFVAHQAAQGVDEVKVYDRLPRAAYFALVAEARRRGLEVVGHRPLGVGARELAAAGQKSVEHARVFLHEAWPGAAELRTAADRGAWKEDRRRMVDEHDPAMAAQIFAAFREHGTWYVPTHLTRWSDAYADHPAVREDSLLRYLHPLMRWQLFEDLDATIARDSTPAGRQAYRDFHHKALEITGLAHAAGVRILTGTDYIVAGADVHRELELLVSAGLSPAAALETATLNPARYYGREKEQGRVAPGMVADLLLLEANPLADIRNTRRIRAVVFNGNLYDRTALDSLQALVASRARSVRVAARILWRFVKQPVGY